ncbi:hypothetical protein JST97_07855 [bacterium]|nr:hypothetical protein [bacterium]
MKIFRRILAIVVLLALGLIAIAQEKSELLIDSARNAAMKFKSSGNADGVSGSFGLAGDVAKGLTTGTVDLKFNPDTAKQVGDISGALYVSMTEVMQAVGNLDMPVPPEMSKDVSKLAINIESVLKDGKGYAKGDLNVDGKANEAIPTVNVDGNLKTDANNFDGKVTFDVESSDMGKVPFKQFDFGISEKEASTTFSIGASVDAAGQEAQGLKQMGQNPDKIKQQITQGLSSSGITVEKVEVGEYKEENGVASAKLSVTLKGWRDVVKTNVGMLAGGGRFDGAKMTAAVSNMLEAKFDSITFTMKYDGKKLNGELAGKIGNTSKFLLGYYELTAQITEAQLKEQGDSDDQKQRFLLAYQSVAMEEAQRAMQAMIEANVGVEGKGSFKLSPEGEDKKGFKASGDFSMDFSNFDAYAQKATAAGLPSAKKAAFKFNLGINDKQHLAGTLFGSSDVNLINYYKKLFLATAKKAGAPEEALKTAESVEFKSGAGAFSISKEGVKGSSYLESNDLSPLVKAGLSAATGGKFEGELTGFAVNGKTEGEKMNIDGTINFAKLMPGKSAEELKQQFGGAEVNDKASADDVKLVAVAKPEVAMPDSLKPVAADGEKLLESNPVAAVAGALGGKGGGGSLIYILGGLAAVGVVGVGVAAGRKKG